MDLSNPEKYVCIGDEIICDIMFGNLNRMATIWVNGYNHYVNELETTN